MALIESIEDEVIRLRQEITDYKAKELEHLRALLVQVSHERDHYRAEASRIAGTGQQIASGFQQVIADLRARLEAKDRENADNRRIVR